MRRAKNFQPKHLLARVAQQDAAALSELYDRYAPRVYGLMARILPSRDTAEEILQEVFVRLWSESPALSQEGGSVAAWLVVTAREIAVDRLRAQRKSALKPAAPPGSNASTGKKPGPIRVGGGQDGNLCAGSGCARAH